MTRPEHWEPPDPPKLLVSAKRVALELDVPNWKANEICWCLERVFYAPGQAHYRVTRASLDAFRELLEQGLTIAAARAVCGGFGSAANFHPPISTASEWTTSTGCLVSEGAGNAL